jgi:hypothetical protein
LNWHRDIGEYFFPSHSSKPFLKFDLPHTFSY